MPNVLIRDLAADDLALLRAAAAEAATSLQAYLRDALHAQATHLRRRDALERSARRLRALPAVPDGERGAVLDAIEQAHAARADQLSAPGP